MLMKAELRETELKKAELEGTELRKAELREAELRNAELREAELREHGCFESDSTDGKNGPCETCAKIYVKHVRKSM